MPNPADLAPGIALIRQRQFASAGSFFRALLAGGGGWEAWYYLGVSQHGLGQLEQAALSFSEAVARAPDATHARCARATVLAALGKTQEAEEELRRAVAATPADGEALFNLAVLVEQRGAGEEAALLYDRALQADPSHYGARLNRGALRLAQGEAEAALEDFDLLDATRVETHLNRTRALFQMLRDREALDAAESALAIAPTNARARLDKVIALASTGRLEEARVVRTSFGLEAMDQLDPFALYVSRALERNATGDWRDRDSVIHALRQAVRGGSGKSLADPGTLIHSLAYPLDETEIRLLAEVVATGIRAKAATIAVPAALKAAVGRRIRVGFITPEARDHLGAYVLRRLFGDRDQARFEYFLYALNSDDGSTIRRELQISADLFIDASSWDASQLAARLRGDALDILVDRTGYFNGSRPEVLALRCAPLQVGFMGTPCTLGEGLLDYRISDADTTPGESQRHWAEKLVLLPSPHAVFDADLPWPQTSRAQFGVPEDALVLCHFDLPFRIGPEVFDIWMRLLARVPRSVLWLLDGGKLFNANLRARAREGGIDDARLLFAPASPYMAHLGCLVHADLFLDTFFYSARSMAFNALRAGVPVLTCPGNTMASRLALPFLVSMGLVELVAESPEAYERKALHYLTDRDALTGLKKRVAEARGGPAFDTRSRVRAVERAFIALVERHRAGLPPATLTIE